MFTAPLSPVEEYWVGYFRADGCISRRGNYRNAQFAQNTQHPVEELALFLGKQGKVRTCSRKTNFGPCTYYSISSARLGYAMDKLGAKTQLEPSLYGSKHFWRGLLDGDGCVKLDRTGYGHNMVEWNGSSYDLVKLQQFLAFVLGCKPPELVAHSSIHRVALTSNKARHVCRLLYEGEYSANLDKAAKALELASTAWATHSSSWRPS